MKCPRCQNEARVVNRGAFDAIVGRGAAAPAPRRHAALPGAIVAAVVKSPEDRSGATPVRAQPLRLLRAPRPEEMKSLEGERVS